MTVRAALLAAALAAALLTAAVVALPAQARPDRITLTGGPTDPSPSTSASFTFDEAALGNSIGVYAFGCFLQVGQAAAPAETPCSSPVTYTGLQRGTTYTFTVEAATDDAALAAGDIVTTGSATWTVSPAAVAAPVRAEDGTFLCYSSFQTDPGVWPMSRAQTLFTLDHYWKPYAVVGLGTTQLGAYRLVCNLGPDMVATGAVIGATGESGPSGMAQVLGWYPVAAPGLAPVLPLAPPPGTPPRQGSSTRS